MAEESPVQNLCDETTCPICLEYFKDPVIIDCGHIFCQACITQCWGDPEKDACCPQCREPCQQRNFRPNRQLASIVEIARKFSLQMVKGSEALGRVCKRHQEPLKLFCEDDQAPICVVCDKSKEHRGHKVIPKEEAFEEYKGKLMSHLKFLNTEREEILSFKVASETESQNLMEKTERERQKIVAEFKQLHQFLEEQEKFLLSQLKDLDDEIKCCRDNHIAKLSEEISSTDRLIKEVEEKEKQTANEFLQDLKNILQRCNKEKFVNPTAFPPEINKQIDCLSEMHSSLETVVKNFKDTVLFTLQENKEILCIHAHVSNRDETSFSLNWSHPKIAVDAYVIRVDPKMGCLEGELICLSGTQTVFECRRLKPTEEYIVTIQAKKGQCGPPVSQTVPRKKVAQKLTAPKLFLSSSTYFPNGGYNNSSSGFTFGNTSNTHFCWSTVMGTERITSGCHSWVVNVGTRNLWTVGVAKEKTSKKAEIWAVGRLPVTGGQQSVGYSVYCAFASEIAPQQFSIPGNFTDLRLSHSPQKICVSLNYEQGSVTFSDADDGSTLYTFKNASFCQEELCSFLNEGKLLGSSLLGHRFA